jgi:hypothetical protein
LFFENINVYFNNKIRQFKKIKI